MFKTLRHITQFKGHSPLRVGAIETRKCRFLLVTKMEMDMESS